MARPDTLVFDIGNVLIAWDAEIPYRRLMPDAETRKHFMEVILPPEWNLEQDRGRTWAEAEALQIALHPDHAELIRAYRANWHEMIPGEITPNMNALRAVRAAGLPNFAITNFAGDTFTEAQKRFPELAGFDGIVVSAHERLLKPDPAIYAVFLARFGKSAAQCLFMDDSAKNIAAAAKMGFSTIHVTPQTDLLADIRAHGFKV